MFEYAQIIFNSKCIRCGDSLIRYRRNAVSFLMFQMPRYRVAMFSFSHHLVADSVSQKSTMYKLLVSNSHKQHTLLYACLNNTPFATCNRIKIHTEITISLCGALQYRFVSCIQILRFHFYFKKMLFSMRMQIKSHSNDTKTL